MNSELLTSALVSMELSSCGTDIKSPEMMAIVEDVTKRHRNTLIEINIDSRYLAVGTIEPTRMYEIAIGLSEAAYSAIFNAVQIELLLVKILKPSSVLAVTSMLTRPHFYELTRDQSPSISWNFVNNASLFLFEENIKNRYDATSFGYTVYDKEEIISDQTEKFDMVIAHGLSFLEKDFFEATVANLSTGGALLVHGANDSSTIYTSKYKWHSHYDFHKALSEMSGKSFHIANFYGTTVFIKG